MAHTTMRYLFIRNIPCLRLALKYSMLLLVVFLFMNIPLDIKQGIVGKDIQPGLQRRKWDIDNQQPSKKLRIDLEEALDLQRIKQLPAAAQVVLNGVEMKFKYHQGPNVHRKLNDALQSVYSISPEGGALVDVLDETFHKDEVSMPVDDMISDLKTTTHTYPFNPIPKKCNRTYALHKLPKTSVIITFHTEERLGNILHTIHSIIQRTPPVLLEEIILVDDASTTADHKGVLKSYIETFFKDKVMILRNDERMGLVRSRLLGILAASGEAVVCMDSHMEVQTKWLESLLHELVFDPTTLASSYLDWVEVTSTVDQDRNGRTKISGAEHDTKINWTYIHGASTWKTYFDWELRFGFQDIPPKEKYHRESNPTVPIESPVTVGGIWAIKKDFFLKIGGLDEGMDGWGGENIDLSLRVWLFGGRVVNVPCSHVAHLEYKNNRNYRLLWKDKTTRNYQRVVEVWFDEFKHLFYLHHKDADKTADIGNLKSRLHLKTQAIHDMDWYFKFVFPELGNPDQDALAFKELRNKNTGLCADKYPIWSLGSTRCDANSSLQAIYWTRRGALRFSMHFINVQPPGVSKIDDVITNQHSTNNAQWVHWPGGLMIEWTSRKCLAQPDKYSHLQLLNCDFNSPAQRWSFLTYTDKYDQLINSNRGLGTLVSLLDRYSKRNDSQAIHRIILNSNIILPRTY